MTPAPIRLAGERLMLDSEGAVFWPARRLLAVADLHFEKGSAAAAQGSLVPPWDTRATLDRLAGLLRRYRPETVVALGDSFHDPRGAARLQQHDLARLKLFASSHRFVWVLGNHDPTPAEGLGGESVPELLLGPLRFVHQSGRDAAVAEVCGHFHPKAQVQVRGAIITRPCFALDARRLMLPALGAYTGGLDIRDPAIGSLFPRGGRAFLLGRDRLFSFPFPSSRPHPATRPAGRLQAPQMPAPPAAKPDRQHMSGPHHD